MATSARPLSSGHIIYDLKRTIPVSLPKKGREQLLVTRSLAELIKLAEVEATRSAALAVMRARIDRMNHFRVSLGQETLSTAEDAARWERQLFSDAAQDPRVTAHKIKSSMAKMPMSFRETPLRSLVGSRNLAAIEVEAMGLTVKNGHVVGRAVKGQEFEEFGSIRHNLDRSLQAIGRSFAVADARQSLRGVEQVAAQMTTHRPRFLGYGSEQTKALRSALEVVERRLASLGDDPMGLDVDLDARQRSVETRSYTRASKEAAALISERVDQMIELVGESSRLTLSEFVEVQKSLKALQIELGAMAQTAGIDISEAHDAVVSKANVDAMAERLNGYSDAVKMRFDAARYFMAEHPTEVKNRSAEPRSARSTPGIEREDNELEQIYAADLLISVKDAEFQEGVWALRGRLSAEQGASYVPLSIS